ncbi:hypothetical protein FK529_11765 [Tsukamurella asaccharolytica]|uniref:PucR C-terminal helix-turn-helix domain-containing protein n=1 Tax=Tsukamurella asaccharolytica TaxID=2592067 RepID=A0A5C5R9Q5_9ACTN|nr:helix-turn-helix domain-containing protein [Tsukamurella asaccharolytica]TWS19184.1 hypothetical protein FK529_11765 [Tsukamurella asaccharolytica]
MDQSPPALDDELAAPTLDTVMEVATGGLLRPLGPFAANAVPVRRLNILDDDEPHLRPGDIVLAVGLPAANVPRMLADAREAGVAAVIISGPAATALPQHLAESGIAVFSRSFWDSWEDAAVALRLALAGAYQRVQAPAPGVELDDLDGLADFIAEQVGGSVTIEDLRSNVLAYSSSDDEVDSWRRNAILRRQVPQERVAAMADTGFLAAVLASHDVVHRPADDGHPERLVVAIRAAEEVLGSIWVADLRVDVAQATAALQRIAPLVAAHLLHAAAAKAGRQRSATAEIEELLYSTTTTLSAAATHTDLYTDGPAIVLHLVCSPDAEIRANQPRVSTLSRVVAADCGCRVAPLWKDSELRLLLTDFASVASAERGGWKVAQALAERPELGARTPRIGVGDAVPTLREAPASRASAELASDALRFAGRSGAARLIDVAESAALQAIDHQLRGMELPTSTPVDHLRCHDQEHGTDLARTLRVYLDEFGSVSATAAALGYHPNTLRYRLGRIQEICGIDLGDRDARLLAQIQLSLLHP